MISVRSKVQIFPGPPIPGGALPLGMRGTWENRDEDGAIAQLGERLLCKQEVVGSIPSGSTRPEIVGRPASKSMCSAVGSRRRFIDIVKKGYARDAGQRPRHLWAFGVPSVVASHTGACAAGP